MGTSIKKNLSPAMNETPAPSLGRPPTEQDSLTPRNVKHASSTQFQANTLPSRTVRNQADESNVTTQMQDNLEASNNRFDKLVETLQSNDTSLHPDGGGMRAKPHKYGGEALRWIPV